MQALDNVNGDFLIEVLLHVFHKDQQDAVRLSNRVRTTGTAQIGLYTREIALTKVKEANRVTERFGYSLLFRAEEAN